MLKEQGRAGQSRAERADKRQGDYRTLNSFIIIKWENEGEKRFYVKIVLSLSFLLFCVHKKIVWIDAEMRNGLNVATAADATLKFIDLRFTEHEWKRASKGKTTKILSLLWIYRAGCKLSSCQAFSSFFLFCVYVAIFFVSHFISYLFLVGSSIIMRHKRILTNGIIGFGKLLCGRYKMIIIMTFTLCRKAIWKQNNCFDGTEDRGRERERRADKTVLLFGRRGDLSMFCHFPHTLNFPGKSGVSSPLQLFHNIEQMVLSFANTIIVSLFKFP